MTNQPENLLFFVLNLKNIKMYSKKCFIRKLFFSCILFSRFRHYFLHSDLFFTDSNRNYSVSSHFSHFQSFKTFTYFWPYSPVPFRAKSPKVEKLKMNPKVSNLFVLNLKNSKMYSKKWFVQKKKSLVFSLYIFSSFRCFLFHSDFFFHSNVFIFFSFRSFFFSFKSFFFASFFFSHQKLSSFFLLAQLVNALGPIAGGHWFKSKITTLFQNKQNLFNKLTYQIQPILYYKT